MYRKTQSIFVLIIRLKISSGIKEPGKNGYINHYYKKVLKVCLSLKQNFFEKAINITVYPVVEYYLQALQNTIQKLKLYHP